MAKRRAKTGMDEMHEVVSEAIERHMDAVRYNLTNMLGGLLYTVKLEGEKRGCSGDLDVLINTIIRTSRNEVRHGDEMPVWDDESCREEIRRLTETLQAHGIEQAWNFGRSRHLKPSRDGNVREL